MKGIYVCNHPGLAAVNGCPEDEEICCGSCNKDDCEFRCKSVDSCTDKRFIPNEQ